MDQVRRKCIIVLLALSVALKMRAQQRSLDYFVNTALVNSPLLKDYRNQVISNSIDSERILATFRPQINGSSNNSYAPVVHGMGYDGAVTNGANVTALVGVNKALVGQRNLQSQLTALGLNGQGIANTSRLSEQDLRRTIIAQYITTYGALQQLAFSTEIGTLLSKEDSILKRLTDKNVYRQTDYLTFLVTLQQQALMTRQAAIQYQTDYLNLNYLSGINDTTMTDLVAPRIDLSTNYTPEASLFYHQFTLDSLRLKNERLLVGFSYKPKVNLFADIGYVSSMMIVPYKNFGTSFGFSMTVPIYDGKQKHMQYRKLDLAEETRIGYRDFFKKQYSQQVTQLLKQLQGTEELIGQIQKQIKYAEGLIEVNAKLLATGDVKIADLIIALNNYLTARNLLTQNTVSRLQIINQVNYWNR